MIPKRSYSYAHEVDSQNDYAGMQNKFARLEGLLPNTVYFFVIVDSEGVSNSNERISIIAGGDSRNYREARQSANKMVAKLHPHMVMFGGDMTGGDNPKQWMQWMNDWQLTSIPIGGNLAQLYTLNSLIAANGEQAEWLEQELISNHREVYWQLAQYHFATRPHTKRKAERNNQMNYWSKLFYKYGVDLVVESDAHVVKTTYPLKPSRGSGSEQGFVRDDNRGTVYVGEGCWGAPLRPNDDDKNWTRASGSFNQFKWMFIDKEGIEVRTVLTDTADKVGDECFYDRFCVPSGIGIWNPPTGDVLYIDQRDNVSSIDGTSSSKNIEVLAFNAKNIDDDQREIKWITRNENESVNYELQKLKLRIAEIKFLRL